MSSVDLSQRVGLVAAVTMPLWNIPLIVRVIRRRSCGDLSLFWMFGVWASIVLMLPASLLSTDKVLRALGVGNALFFSAVVAVVLYYRRFGETP